MQNAAVQIGYFEQNPTFVDNDLDPGLVFGLYDLEWDLAMPYIEAAHKAFPCLRDAGVRSEICGPESFTPDGKPIFGEAMEVLKYVPQLAWDESFTRSAWGSLVCYGTCCT